MTAISAGEGKLSIRASPSRRGAARRQSFTSRRVIGPGIETRSNEVGGRRSARASLPFEANQYGPDRFKAHCWLAELERRQGSHFPEPKKAKSRTSRGNGGAELLDTTSRAHFSPSSPSSPLQTADCTPSRPPRPLLRSALCFHYPRARVFHSTLTFANFKTFESLGQEIELSIRSHPPLLHVRICTTKRLADPIFNAPTLEGRSTFLESRRPSSTSIWFMSVESTFPTHCQRLKGTILNGLSISATALHLHTTASETFQPLFHAS